MYMYRLFTLYRCATNFEDPPASQANQSSFRSCQSSDPENEQSGCCLRRLSERGSFRREECCAFAAVRRSHCRPAPEDRRCPQGHSRMSVCYQIEACIEKGNSHELLFEGIPHKRCVPV